MHENNVWLWCGSGAAYIKCSMISITLGGSNPSGRAIRTYLNTFLTKVTVKYDIRNKPIKPSNPDRIIPLKFAGWISP